MFSFLDTSAFEGKRTKAVLPRGFTVIWRDNTDHHLLQIAYNLDYNESFLEKGRQYGDRDMPPPIVQDASRVDSAFTSWRSDFILNSEGQ
jgi:hypothetical protein